MKLSRAILPGIFMMLMFSGLSLPVLGNGVPPSLGFEHNGVVTSTLDVTVSTTFTLDILIKDITAGYGMVGFQLIIEWNPALMELVKFVEADEFGESRPWDTYHNELSGKIEYFGTGEEWTTDASWARTTFHCLKAGTSEITVYAPPILSIDLVPLEGGIRVSLEVGPVALTCNQQEPRPGGGIVAPVNKLELLAPYLALAGLMIALSAVVVVKKAPKA